MKLALMAVLLLTGCGNHRLPMSKANYVRKNNCKFAGEKSDTKIYTMGTVQHVPGWKGYICPDDVRVVIENDEEQP